MMNEVSYSIGLVGEVKKQTWLKPLSAETKNSFQFMKGFSLASDSPKGQDPSACIVVMPY